MLTGILLESYDIKHITNGGSLFLNAYVMFWLQAKAAANPKKKDGEDDEEEGEDNGDDDDEQEEDEEEDEEQEDDDDEQEEDEEDEQEDDQDEDEEAGRGTKRKAGAKAKAKAKGKAKAKAKAKGKARGRPKAPGHQSPFYTLFWFPTRSDPHLPIPSVLWPDPCKALVPGWQSEGKEHPEQAGRADVMQWWHDAETGWLRVTKSGERDSTPNQHINLYYYNHLYG